VCSSDLFKITELFYIPIQIKKAMSDWDSGSLMAFGDFWSILRFRD